MSKATSNLGSALKRSSSLSWLLRFSILPLLVMIVGLGYVALGEWNAYRECQRRILQYQVERRPFDNVSMAAIYRERTYLEGAEVWNEILDSASTLSFGDAMPLVAAKELPLELDPEAAWEDEAAVASYLDRMEPLFQLLKSAEQYPRPVRVFIQFDGLETLLENVQGSVRVMRILMLDFEWACYRGETERALRDLRWMQMTTEAFDANLCMVAEMGVVRNRLMMVQTIGRSLAHCRWSNEQLETLRKDMEKTYYSEVRWRHMMESEKALVFASLATPSPGIAEASRNFLPLLPSGKLEILEMYDRFAELGKSPLDTLRWNCEQLDRQLALESRRWSINGAEIWRNLVRMNMSSVAGTPIQEENSRRWLVTGIALCQFKRQHGKFPNSLTELESMGVSRATITTVQGEYLGYELEDGIAHLWGPRIVEAWNVLRRPALDSDPRERGWAEYVALR